MTKELKHKPLVEAILEIRWGLEGKFPGSQTDPHYKLLLGRLFDRIISDYPEHEQLSAANWPDEFVGYMVQHRFRVAANSWPLVQIGPGIFTVNSTDDYTWQDFRPRVTAAIKKLFDAHPNVEELKITNLVLRYIDAVDFDFNTNNAIDFLRDKLKVDISLPDTLFTDTGVENKPNRFTFQSSFECQNPKGLITIRFATGQNHNSPAVVWETTVESAGVDVPEMPKKFDDWINAAHKITDDWFFKMIEGELERKFSGE
ncbi:MAG: TIGR04255 family protein [Candidatus Hydrogenedentales bacterium]|jgi:uncharacterized protein (TIGR04255 family)